MQKGLAGYDYFCGGAILNQKWIITAAHCLEEVKAEDLKIVVGTHDIKKRLPKDEYNIDKIINHENYRVGSGGELINDIALLRVSNSIDMSSDLVKSHLK
ncbi:chymotrypsin-2-like protein [Leptotrombidium deliense]|uniref:Chymotrypsin-2-like protein n=1 Tax=Leptotrombidium deliense TaxID=299467 RepID=A0A443S704_9ACAR|nr:chymotrypsin-2-like protein [Leptotrombidium deliense]